MRSIQAGQRARVSGHVNADTKDGQEFVIPAGTIVQVVEVQGDGDKRLVTVTVPEGSALLSGPNLDTFLAPIGPDPAATQG